jgi:hypothetical protein
MDISRQQPPEEQTRTETSFRHLPASSTAFHSLPAVPSPFHPTAYLPGACIAWPRPPAEWNRTQRKRMSRIGALAHVTIHPSLTSDGGQAARAIMTHRHHHRPSIMHLAEWRWNRGSYLDFAIGSRCRPAVSRRTVVYTACLQTVTASARPLNASLTPST